MGAEASLLTCRSRTQAPAPGSRESMPAEVMKPTVRERCRVAALKKIGGLGKSPVKSSISRRCLYWRGVLMACRAAIQESEIRAKIWGFSRSLAAGRCWKGSGKAESRGRGIEKGESRRAGRAREAARGHQSARLDEDEWPQSNRIMLLLVFGKRPLLRCSLFGRIIRYSWHFVKHRVVGGMAAFPWQGTIPLFQSLDYWAVQGPWALPRAIV